MAQSSNSAYGELLEAGIKIVEYPLVGSANMDRRSPELNYENNILVSDPVLTAAARSRQGAYLEAGRAVLRPELEEWGFWRRLMQNAVAMLAPVL